MKSDVEEATSIYDKLVRKEHVTNDEYDTLMQFATKFKGYGDEEENKSRA